MTNSSFGAPVLVRADNTAEVLRPVPLSKKGQNAYDELWLQRLLFRHPEALPIAEIDASFLPLVPLCMEMDTPAGPVDAVYVTPTGRLALLETKLWRNPEARREVIGQILDYAKELPSWDYSRLDVSVRQARKKHPGAHQSSFPGIAEFVAQSIPGLAGHHFQDAVTRSLAKGDYLLLIAGDGIREGVGAIAQFLDRNGALHFTFGLIECAIYGAPGGGHYVHPRVLATTTKIMRTVFVSETGQATTESEEAEESVAGELRPELIERRAKYQNFWNGVLQRMSIEAEQELPRPARGWTQTFSMPKGSNSWMAAYLIQSVDEVAVALVFEKNPKGDQVFDALSVSKDEINSALGVDADWRTKNSRNEDQKFVICSKRIPGDFLTDAREVVQDWLATYSERFISVFRPRIDHILREMS